jgi:hypothetical protein
MKIVLFAGQSNALGYGMDKSTLPLYLDQFDFGPTYIRTNDALYWGQLDPGVNTGTPNYPQAWGPEVAFAYSFRLAHPTEPLLIIKSVKGETPLEFGPGMDWSPSSIGEMFDITSARVDRAMADGGWPLPQAVFWIQGEQDALSLASATDYKLNLSHLIDVQHGDWSAMGSPFIIARITDSPYLPYSQAVREAQWQLDQERADVSSFKTIGLPMQADGVHYGWEGHVTIGRNFFEAWHV